MNTKLDSQMAVWLEPGSFADYGVWGLMEKTLNRCYSVIMICAFPQNLTIDEVAVVDGSNDQRISNQCKWFGQTEAYNPEIRPV